MAKKFMKRCSTYLIIREMQIKTTMRYHLTPFRRLLSKRQDIARTWGGYGQRNTWHCWWECKLMQPL